MFKIKSRSITFKILVMILTICLLESMLFTVMSENTSKRNLGDIITEYSRKNAVLYSEFVGGWLKERMNEIEIYANTPLVKSMDWDSIEPYLKSEVNKKLDIYDHFMIADSMGNYNTTLIRNAGNVYDRSYFQSAMSGLVTVSEPMIARSTGKPVAVVAAPVKDGSGKIVGVMAGTINLVKLSKIIYGLKYNYPNSYSYIVDKNGLIIAHPNKEYILTKNINRSSPAPNFPLIAALGEIPSYSGGSDTYIFENKDTLSYYHAIPNTNDWKIVIKIPVDYWHTPIKDASTQHILIGLIGLIAASVFGFFVAGSISKPIIRLREVFTKATAGDLTVRSEIDSDDEIGDAARSFNKMMDTITRLTYYDTLTHLPNRMMFNNSLDIELKKAEQSNSRLAVMIIDVDKFESINNTLGHTAGDKLLKSLAEKINRIIDHDHIVCHMGEDRFAILFRNFKEKEEIIKLSEEVRDAVKQPWIVDEHRFYITACAGMALYPEDGNTSDTLFKNAFSAMQKAKGRGRDSFELYDPSANSWLLEQMNLDSSMHHALDNDEFSIYYQPQVDAESGEIIGCEALLRWNHPELGTISPLKFIPISEANGLIISIGRWVLYTACMQNKLWQDSGFKPIYVSVNLSAVQLMQEDFISMVSGVLEETGLSPEYLELEITESVAVKNHEHISSILEELKKMGIRIALDDFGTGYSSLNYLKNFAITTLKIDRSFICDIVENPKNSAIVSTILAMGRHLKLNVTAEGVETREQFDALKDKGCRVIQGYYFSKPLSLNEFEKLMKRPGE